MNVKSFDDLVMDLDVVGFFPARKKLASGRESNYYANCRRLTDTADVALLTAKLVAGFADDVGMCPDHFLGVPDGATKLGLLVNLVDNLEIDTRDAGAVPLVQMRKHPKAHGDAKDRYLIGPVSEGQYAHLVISGRQPNDEVSNAFKRLNEAGVGIVDTLNLPPGREVSTVVAALRNGERGSADMFVGIPDGATMYGLLAGALYALGDKAPYDEVSSVPFVQMRAKPTDDSGSLESMFVGHVKEGDSVVFIEDVTTTGGSLMKKIVAAKNAGLIVVGAIGLVNRLETTYNVGDIGDGIVVEDGLSVKDALDRLGVPYHWMTDSHRLLPLAQDKYDPGDAVLEAIERDFNMYGVKPFEF